MTISAACDRAVGVLLGLAVGDAVGTTLEFKAPGSFEPITDMVGGGPFGLEPGQWTDDTSMALCLAESLVDVGSMDLADQLRRYLLWFDEGYLSSTGRCFDIGTTTLSQLERFRRTGQPTDLAPDEHAAANGSLMRLGAVPIRWHTDHVEAGEWSAESSRSTHPGTRPVDACRAFGSMVAALIAGEEFDAVVAHDRWAIDGLHPAVAAIVGGSWSRKEPPGIRGSGYCVDAFEAAVWAVAGANDFASAVLRAANLGDDADTTAAIAGQLAGARWGAAGIPIRWRQRVAAGDRIVSLARNLFHASIDDPDAAWVHDELVHGWWVEPGRLLAGEYPGTTDPDRARLKLDVLVDAGVRTFIDLTTEDDRLEPYRRVLGEIAMARQVELHHRSFPIPDLSVVDDADYDPMLAAIERGFERGAVYVHCWGGIGRTGTVIGCYLVDSGLSHDMALAHIGRLRAGTRKAHRPAPETDTQRAVIRRRETG